MEASGHTPVYSRTNETKVSQPRFPQATSKAFNLRAPSTRTRGHPGSFSGPSNCQSRELPPTALQPGSQLLQRLGPSSRKGGATAHQLQRAILLAHSPVTYKIRQAALSRKATPACRRRLVTELLKPAPTSHYLVTRALGKKDRWLPQLCVPSLLRRE